MLNFADCIKYDIISISIKKFSPFIYRPLLFYRLRKFQITCITLPNKLPFDANWFRFIDIIITLWNLHSEETERKNQINENCCKKKSNDDRWYGKFVVMLNKLFYLYLFREEKGDRFFFPSNFTFCTSLIEKNFTFFNFTTVTTNVEKETNFFFVFLFFSLLFYFRSFVRLINVNFREKKIVEEPRAQHSDTLCGTTDTD